MQNYHLHLRGFVGGYDFDKNYVDYVLNKNQGKPVAVLIDSLGGSLATALSIASAFRNHGQVTVHFVGMNASAATIASLGAQKITMDASAMYLAHKCSTEFFQWAQLNADQLQGEIDHLEQMKTDLEKMDANVARMYTAKCKDKKKTCSQILDLMKVGGWLTAQEALDWGFVDELTDDMEDDAPVLTDAVASAMASVGMPIPNLPVQQNQSSQFSKFLNAIAGLFRGDTASPQAPTNSQNTTPMNKLFPLLASVLAVESFAIQDGACAMTEAQLEALEQNLKAQQDSHTAAIQEKDNVLAALQAEKDALAKEKAELEAQVKEQADLLANKPGDSTSQVVNNGGKPSEALTQEEEYVQMYNRARAMYDEVP